MSASRTARFTASTAKTNCVPVRFQLLPLFAVPPPDKTKIPSLPLTTPVPGALLVLLKTIARVMVADPVLV